MKTIPLSKGHEAIVDEEDYEALAIFKWSAQEVPGKVYAKRAVGSGPRHRTLLLHRVITGAEQHQLVDHINGNGLDNRRSNLRIANKSENGQNQRTKRANTTSRYKGVHFYKSRNKWVAEIKHKGVRRSLGYFESEDDAARAYNAAAVETFGEFAALNEVAA